MADLKLNENVRVVVRCRPLNTKELTCGYFNVVNVIKSINTIEVFNPKIKDFNGKTFTFDDVYDCNASQEDIYIGSVQNVVDSVLNGFNGTILAYGQTGTGKTYTMEGSQSNPAHKGVIPNTFNHIYDHIAQSKNTQYLVRASYVEVYQEEVKDLLSENKDKSYELIGNGSGIQIKGLKSHICRSVKEMETVMEQGKKNRKVGATDMNEHSSRSHAIFIITIEMSKTISGVNHIVAGKLNLVDLAGSEKQSKTCSTGDRLKEATKINLSLSALGNVVSALSIGKSVHIPYRDSKLTRLLQDSLGGNSKTLMIANIGPASFNYEETVTTLRYANRAKNIKNKPTINEDPKDTLIRQYQEEIARLKALLQSKLNKKEKPKVSIHEAKTDITLKKNDTSSLRNSNQLSATSLSDDEKLKQLQIQTDLQHKFLIEKKAYIIETLERQINSMQSRLLQGTNIEQHTKMQQEILKIQGDAIKKTNLRKLKLTVKLGKEEETTEELHDSNTNLQQDIDKKIKNINKLYCKIQTIKEQTAAYMDEFNNDRNDLELAQRELIKEYKLNQIIIDNFIPVSSTKRFLKRTYYDEATEGWKIDYKRDNTFLQLKDVTHDAKYSEREKSRLLSHTNDSLKVESNNIISLCLEPHTTTISKYRRPTIPTIIKSAIQDALKTEEEDMTLDAKTITNTNNCMIRHKTTQKRVSYNFQNKNVIYPKVRGLVKKN